MLFSVTNYSSRPTLYDLIYTFYYLMILYSNGFWGANVDKMHLERLSTQQNVPENSCSVRYCLKATADRTISVIFQHLEYGSNVK